MEEVSIYLDELDERESAPATATRTKPRYSTRGPAWTDESWREYFHRVKHVGDDAADAAEAKEEVVVLIPGRDVEISKLPGRGKPSQVARRLAGQGWEVECRQSLVKVPAVRYLSDSEEGVPAEKAYRKGDVRFPEHELETTVLLAVKRAKDGRVGLAMEATWLSKGGFRLARTYDPLDGHEIRVGFAKGRPPNPIEEEDGIAAPYGLQDWLDDFAPTAASRGRRAAEQKQAQEEQETGVWIGG